MKVNYLDKNGTPIYFIAYYHNEKIYAVWKFVENGNDLIETFESMKEAEKFIKGKLGVIRPSCYFKKS